MKIERNFVTATGKRKASIAKALLFKGTGKIIVNEKSINSYFSSVTNEHKKIKDCLNIVNLTTHLNIILYVKGGGVSSQLDAVCLSIAKALCKINQAYRFLFNKVSFLRSDSRIKERRKYGLKKARKASQYSKR